MFIDLARRGLLIAYIYSMGLFYDNQSKFLEKVVISFGDKSCI